MAQIGSMGGVSAPNTQREYSRSQADPNAFGAGVGRALQGLGASIQSYADFEQRRRRQEEDNQAALAWERHQGETARGIEEIYRNSAADGSGATNQVEAFIRQRNEEFLGGLTVPEVREAYAVRAESLAQSGTSDAFAFEYTRANQNFITTTRQRMSDAQTRVYEDPALLDQEIAAIEGAIRGSTLPPNEQEQLLAEVQLGLSQATFQAELEAATRNNQPVRDPETSGGPVAPGLSPGQAGALSAIAGTESGSGGYYVLNGEERITDLSDHPRRVGAGGTTTAAGKYQFVMGTWDQMAERMVARGEARPTFSPQDQDRVALEYIRFLWEAEGDGTPVNEVLNGGDTPQLRQLFGILRGPSFENARWQGLWKIGYDNFVREVAGGEATGGSYEPFPNAVTDPRFQNLTFEDRMRLTQVSQQNQAANLERTMQLQRDIERNTYESLANSFSNGEPGARERIQEALDTNQIRSLEYRDALRSRVSEYDAAQAAYQFVRTGIETGATFTAEDEKEVMAYYELSGIMEGLRTSDPAAMRQFTETAARMSYVPARVMSMLMAQVGSSDPAAAQFATEVLATLYDRNPQALMAYASEDQVRAATLAATVWRYSANPAEAVGRLRMMTDPANRTQVKALQEAATEEFANVDVYSNLIAEWGTDQTSLPANPNERMALQADYEQLYQEGFVRSGGNPDVAEAYATAQIKYNWAPDPFSGQLMRYSPMSAGAPVLDLPILGREWVGPMIEEATNDPIEVLPGVSAVPDSRFIVADIITQQAFQTGQSPSYRVGYTYTDEYGMETFGFYPERVTIRPRESDFQEMRWGQEMERVRGRAEMLENEINSLRTAPSRTGRTPSEAIPATPAEREMQRELDNLRRRESILRQQGPNYFNETGPTPESPPAPPIEQPMYDALGNVVGVQ